MFLYGNQDNTAELVILHGNCQTPFLAQLLAATYEDKGYLCVLNHAPVGQSPEMPSEDQLRRCVLYLEQHDSHPDDTIFSEDGAISVQGRPIRKYLRNSPLANCPKITFPSFFLTSLWPFCVFVDPRNTPEPGYAWGRYPYGNSLALEVAAQGITGPAALATYKQRFRDALPDPEETLKTVLAKLEERDSHCDVKIADYVWDNFRKRHLFMTYGHVRAEAIGELATRLYAAMHPLLGGDENAALQRLQTALSTLPDMDTMEEPIDPLVAQSLGLTFCTPDMRFRWYNQYWTHDEYMTRYLAYDVNW